MRALSTILIVLSLWWIASAQKQIGCLNHQGHPVEWFVIITTPQTVHKADPKSGYLYYDSTMKTDSFDIHPGYGNEPENPIGRTLAQMKPNQLQSVVWNDQLNTQWGHGSGSSTKAHAKGYLVLTKDHKMGFLMDHSVPKYPSVQQKTLIISPQIEASQRLKAQHHFCVSIRSKKVAQDLFDRTCFINPQIYTDKPIFGRECTKQKSQDRFRYLQIQFSGTSNVKAIYKNGYNMIKNEKGKSVPFETEIFKDGIAPMVSSSIIAQTFGAPPVYDPYCGKPFSVGNSYEMQVNGNTWRQGSDHCKWAYAESNGYVCFGDLNRNTYAQTTRGGAFYCVVSKGLNSAMKKINTHPVHCGRR